MNDRYYRYSDYLKKKYGVKTYKLTVNLPLTCPNRDGTLSQGGCTYCGEDGSGQPGSPESTPVKAQLLDSKNYIAERYGAEKFIAYFQSFTNTYMPLERLKSHIRPALEVEDVVEVALATRPDCINDHYLGEIRALLDEENPEVNLTLEMGLQTANYHTLRRHNRGHTLAEFIDAVLACNSFGVETCAHLILNLPGDDKEDAVETAKIISALGIDTVKLHALYIHKKASLAEQYQRGELDLISEERYIDRVVAFLEHLDPGIAVQRLLGRAPREETLFVNWGRVWSQIHQAILDEMEERNTRQGSKFDYLGGKALRVFEED